MGCGYEPPPPRGLAADPWQHEGDENDRPTTCPGYTCTLPEVVHATRARLHARLGHLDAFLGGELASPALLAALEVLEIETHRAQEWDLAHRKG